MQYQCHLPIPPSGNNLFANGKNGGRFPTKQYKNWRLAAEAMNLTFPEGFPENQCWGLSLNLGPFQRKGFRRGRDIDNAAKAVIDFLCAKTGLEDENLDELLIRREFKQSRRPPDHMIVATLWTLEDEGLEQSNDGLR